MTARSQLAAPPLQPLIKWPGSKRLVATALAELIPRSGRYFEPFLGGGAVLGLQSYRVSFAGDTVPELVDLWNRVKYTPDDVCEAYAQRWNRLQREGHTAYYSIREDFNRSRSSDDLLFLSRTCVNGLIRFNRNGDFNNSLHHTRRGIEPQRFRRVVMDWNAALTASSIACEDFESLLSQAEAGDVVFLDPPYVGTKGRYHPAVFDFERLWAVLDALSQRGVWWMLTLDGEAGNRDYGSNWVPQELFQVRRSISTGLSPFSRLMDGRVDRVTESVYLNFDPDVMCPKSGDRANDHITQLSLCDDM